MKLHPKTGMTEFNIEFRSLVLDAVERLYELELGMMKDDIANGWRCFYAQEVWLEKHLPPPLIDDAGKAANIESLRRIVQGGIYAPLPFPEKQNYRNYLGIGTPDIYLEPGSERKSHARDQVANSVITRLLETEHRNMRFEVRRDAHRWYAEAANVGTLTPPLIYFEEEHATPVRDEDEPLACDTQYWFRVYPSSEPAMDTQYYHALVKPGYVVDLMAQLAPDFPYDAKRGSSKSLFFVRPDERAVQWAVWIDKTDGSTEYRYPPQLVLIRKSDGKIRPDDILYTHHGLKRFAATVFNPRDIEIQLRFHLPRIRRLITFLDPFVDAALGTTS